MKRSMTLSLLFIVSLAGSLMSGGCGNKAEITPEKKAQFGTAHEAMPPGVAEKIKAANEKMQKPRSSTPGAK
jgi:hypothetical protein